MRTLIIYDNNGKVYSLITGSYLTPQGGVQYLEIDIPIGKRLMIVDGIGVDTSVTPHQVILEDIPPTEVELIARQTDAISADLQSFMEYYFENGGV